MLPVLALVTVFATVSPVSSFLPPDATGEILIDPGMHMLARLVSPVTDFSKGKCDSLVREILSARELTLPAARLWLQAYMKRPKQQRAPWRRHAAVMVLAFGSAGKKESGPLLLDMIKSPAGMDYASFPDFRAMQTRAKLREYAAYAYLAVDPAAANQFALEFIKRDPFASRICALILDRYWTSQASPALLDLAGKSSWTTTIATALQVLKRHDSSMYITALQLLTRELDSSAPLFRAPVERFRFLVRRKRLIEAFGICRERAAVKTLVKLLRPQDRGKPLGQRIIASNKPEKALYERSVTEDSLVAIQKILGEDFGYADEQSDAERRAVIERCAHYIRTHM